MRQSIFFYRELTPAEVGKTKTREIYIRLPNEFDYDSFFNHTEKKNGSVIEVNFTANDITNGGNDSIELRFVYFIESNKEKRIPSLGSLFTKHDVQEGDIVCLESRFNDSDISYFISFYKKGKIQFYNKSIYFTCVNQDNRHIIADAKSLGSLQQIFYGAPGTGKSHEIKRLTKGRSVIRTTFHPDSDYSTFVGAYKPVMEDVDVQVVPVVLNKSGIGFDENKGTYKERHIEYKFVKQAFLKAYLAAWKKYTEPKILPISFGTGTSGKWFIMSVGPHVSAKKTIMPLKDFEEKIKEVWKNNQSLDLWNNANDNVINEDAWVEKACCSAVFDSSNATENVEWKDIEEALNAEEGISVTHDGQGYKIKNENGNVVITIDVDKESIRKSFDNKDEESNSNNPLQKSIAGRIRNFSDNFDKAWSVLVKGVNENNVEPQFLIIEEINRGNCAQIFGDIFQLLDRSDNGFSTYPIEADSDIKDEIARAFREDEEYKLSSDISIEGMVDGYTSNFGKTLSKDVQEGRILLLPPNLYIWATMNTSDQSLFPIDSAFKRRWDWKYMPISNNNYNWIIEIGDKKYKWVDFQKEINNRIYGIDNSEDKQLGDYFVNANRTDNKISSYTLLNKILFYLWNDVCKDEPDQIFSWKDDSDGGKEKSIKFSEFFCDEKERDRKLQGLMSFLIINAIEE